MGIRQIRD
jgi:hypothetical protein